MPLNLFFHLEAHAGVVEELTVELLDALLDLLVLLLQIAEEGLIVGVEVEAAIIPCRVRGAPCGLGGGLGRGGGEGGLAGRRGRPGA